MNGAKLALFKQIAEAALMGEYVISEIHISDEGIQVALAPRPKGQELRSHS